MFQGVETSNPVPVAMSAILEMLCLGITGSKT